MSISTSLAIDSMSAKHPGTAIYPMIVLVLSLLTMHSLIQVNPVMSLTAPEKEGALYHIQRKHTIIDSKKY